jgi:hypothetical protein
MITGAKTNRIDPITVRRDLKSILSAPEYNVHPEPSLIRWVKAHIIRPIGKFIQRVFAAIGRSIEWLFEKITARRIMGAMGWFTVVLAWIVVAIFAFLLGLIIRWVVKNVGDSSVDKPDEDELEAYELPSAAPLIKEAAKLADSGDFRGAFRTAYLAIISYLDEIKALRFERSRTNWEYLRELKQGGHEKPYDELRPLTMNFDRKIYGREDCNNQDYLEVAGAYDRIAREVKA